MVEDRRVWGSYPHELAKVRVARVAYRQHNRIASHQLTRLGLGRSTVRDWTRAGYLHPRLRGVYAVGSGARTTESDLFEAVLYAGPGAMLSHATGAWWLDLIDHPSPAVHVSTPRRRVSPRGMLIHSRRLGLERVMCKGIPTTTVAQALLDLAAAGELTQVRRALARLDYQRRFDPHALLALCGSGGSNGNGSSSGSGSASGSGSSAAAGAAAGAAGRRRRGSDILRWAIAHYDPRFALTRSPLEDDWLSCCEALDIPKPDDVNVEICGISVDACYYDAKLIIEFDGIDNHRSPAQIRRDRRNELTLRTAGWLPLRYTSDLIREDAAGVRAEVLRYLATRAGSGSHPQT